jgi:uncharacterized protein YejL (UPF0352 family)
MNILRFWASGLVFSFNLLNCLMAQTPAEVRRAFVNLRSDHIKHNCGRAADWLYDHRDKIIDQMIQELYLTDRQGRDALLHVLFNTDSFSADDRFRRFVMARLPEEDRAVGTRDILIGYDSSSRNYQGTIVAHWEAWEYIDVHFKDFEALLKDEISHSNSMFVLWGTTWVLAKHRALTESLNLYDDQVMGRIASNLRNDDIPYNAGQAVRTFLLLGKYSIPTLHNSARDSDNQMASFSRALIDSIQYGKHEAFGYINAQVYSLNLPPTLVESDRVEEPGWLAEITGKYVEALDRNPNLPYP